MSSLFQANVVEKKKSPERKSITTVSCVTSKTMNIPIFSKYFIRNNAHTHTYIKVSLWIYLNVVHM